MPMPVINRPPIAPTGQSAPAQQQGAQPQPHAAARSPAAAGPQQPGRPDPQPAPAAPQPAPTQVHRCAAAGGTGERAAGRAGTDRPGPAVRAGRCRPGRCPARSAAARGAAGPAGAQQTQRRTAAAVTSRASSRRRHADAGRAPQAAPQQPGAQPPQAPQPLPSPRPTPRPQPAAPAQRVGQPRRRRTSCSRRASRSSGSRARRGAAETRQAEAFDLGETTPIFEEIASAWFRSNRPIPVDWESTQDDADPAGREHHASRRPNLPPPFTAPAARPGSSLPEQPEPPPYRRRPSSGTSPRWPTRAGGPPATSWRSGPTSSPPPGCPKRRPRARLVPGSAGSAVLAAPAASARSAETIRGRLASYQQGVRQGRESRMRGEQGAAPGANGGSGTGPAGDAGGNHDEESS